MSIALAEMQRSKTLCLRLLSRKRNRASKRAQHRKKQRRVTPLPTRRLKLTSQKLKRLLSALLLRNSPTRIRNRQMKRLVSPTKPLILKRLQATPPMKEIEIRIGGITEERRPRFLQTILTEIRLTEDQGIRQTRASPASGLSRTE